MISKKNSAVYLVFFSSLYIYCNGALYTLVLAPIDLNGLRTHYLQGLIASSHSRVSQIDTRLL